MSALKGTPETKDRFLTLIEEGSTVADACKTLEIARITPYRWCDQDPKFKDEWDHAEKVGGQTLIQAANKRAVKGTKEAIYHQGRIVGWRREYSDQLLMFLIRGRYPEKYRDSPQIQNNLSITLSQLQEAARALEPADPNPPIDVQAEPT